MKQTEHTSRLKNAGINTGLISSERGAIMGLSIVWIVLCHASFDVSRYPTIVQTVKHYGIIGVDFFLFLSAIGLFYSLKKDRHVLSFYKKRLLRILPATVFCYVPWILYRSFIGRKISSIGFLLDVTSLGFWFGGETRGWYVALSLVLYLLFPLLFFFVASKINKPCKALVLIVLVAADIALNVLLLSKQPDWFKSVELAMSRVPVFLVGSFLAPAVYEKRKLGLLPLTLLLGMTVAAACLLWKNWTYPYSFHRYLFMVVTVCGMPFLAFVLDKIKDGQIHRFLAWIGQYTLEIYLIHTQVLYVMKREIPATSEHGLFFINTAAIVLSLGLAVCVHKIFTVKKRGRGDEPKKTQSAEPKKANP